MSDDDLHELVIEWDRQRQLGQEVSPEVLCADRPELLEDLKQRIETVKASDWVFAAIDGTDDTLHSQVGSTPSGDKSRARPTRSGVKVSLDEFLKALVESGVMSAELVASIRQRSPATDASGLAQYLISKKRLTPYQAAVLLEKRPDPLVLDRYVFLKRLESGGMGQMFLAMHRSMRRKVALKILPMNAVDSPEKVQRFRREAEAVAHLSHPNVVTAHDAHDVNGVHFLVMEYVRGHNLKRIVEAKGPLSVRRAVDTILQAARGLSYAHARGVIHRDVKPSNLMRSRDGTIKVLDMGLARFDAPDEEGRTVIGELTQGGLVMGTPTFMAPEQAVDAHSADQRADIYSLGCTLYFLLTGRPPYLEDSGIKMIIAHREQPVPDLDTVRDDVPPELSDLYGRMLAKRPEERIQSMDDVVAELEVIDLPDGPDTETVLFTARDDPSGVGVEPPELSSTSKLRRRFGFRKWKWSAALVGFLVLMVVGALYLSGVLLKVQTEHGTLFVEIPDGLEVDLSVDGNKADIEYTEDGDKVRLQLAADEEHQIAVTARDGTQLKVDHAGHVSVPAGQERVIRAWFDPTPESVVRTAPPEVEPKPESQDLAAPPEVEAEQLHLAGRVPTPDESAAEDVPPMQETIYGSGRRTALGIIPLPQKLPGVRQWQVETVRPRTRVNAAAFSPDGRNVALGMESGLIRVYDSHTFTLVGLLVGHSDADIDIAWSPDGNLLASESHDERVRLWTAAGVPRGVLDHTQGVECIAWSPDGTQLATIDWFGSLRVLNTDGSRAADFEEEGRFFDAVAWSCDGARIAAVDSDNTVRILSLDGQSVVLLEGHSDTVRALAFSPNGKWLASGGNDNTVRLWQSDGTPGPVLKGHYREINELTWCSDSSALASVSTHDGTVRLWSVDGQPGAVLTDRKNPVSAGWSGDAEQVYVAGWRQISRWSADGDLADRDHFDHSIHSLDWSPDSRQLAVGSSDGSMRLRSAEGDHESVLTGHRGEVVLVRWSPQGDKLAAGVDTENEAWVHVWAVGAPPDTASYPFYENRPPFAWSPDGLELAMAHGSSARVWRGIVDAEDVMDDVGLFESLTWSPDGEVLAGGLNGNGDVHLWAPKQRKHLVLKGHPHQVNTIAWSPDSEWFASGSQGDGVIRLWRKDGTPGPLLDGGNEPVKSVVWSPDGKWLAVEGDFDVVQLWQQNGVPGRVFNQPGGGLESRDGLWSPDSSRLAVLGREALHVYWIDGTREVQIPARKAEYTAVDWSLDGSRIAVGASDNTVLVGDGKTIEPLWVTALLPNGQSATFSADGQILDGEPDVLEREIVYLVTPRFGPTEVLKPSEFNERFKTP